VVREAVAELASGQGRVVWIEGEPGIGKSTLIESIIAEAAAVPCQIYRAIGDELGQRFPLRALTDGFRADAAAEIVALLRGEPGSDDSGWAGSPGPAPVNPAGTVDDAAAMDDSGDGRTGGRDAVPAAVERFQAMIDRLAAAGPVVMAFDDLQWADEASLLAWHRLGRLVHRAPLLLVSACRPVPVRQTLAGLRRAAVARGATIVTLGPLEADDVAGLIGCHAGAAPGPRLRDALALAGGNPRYARELFDMLLREDRLRIRAGGVELTGPHGEPPSALGRAVGHRLDFLSIQAGAMLRVAALLGAEFSAYDLAIAAGHPAGALLPALDEATSAGVLTEVGDRFQFRHGLVRHALYQAVPESVRAALHRQVARALADAGVPVDRVAVHLAAMPGTVDGWVVDWLATHADALADRAAHLAAVLLPEAARQCDAGDPRHEPAVRGLARALYRLKRLDEAEAVARHACAVSSDPARTAEMAWLLGAILFTAGRYADALSVLDESVARPGVPPFWRARLLAWRAKALPYAGRRAEGEAEARRALAEGERLADRVTIGHALHTLYLVADHETGVAHAGRALEVIGDLAETIDLRIALLANRAYNLEALGRSEPAEAAMREALLLAERLGSARFPEIRVRMAGRCIELGRWDDAWAELEPLTGNVGLFERLVRLGGMAFIATHRDDRGVAEELLADAAKLPEITGYLQGSATLLYLARAVAAEQRGGCDSALAVLAGTIEADGQDLHERHLWMPDLVRLALAAGDAGIARAAVDAAEADAAAEPLPRRIASARRARAVLDGDTAALLALASGYRAAVAPLALGQTCEEAAVLLAQAGDVTGARAALTDAVRAYLELGAGWDVRRADARLRQCGVRRGPRTVRRRPTAGWEALTPTEVRVSALVAQGRSNPEIAAAMLLSRRTVQAHVSNILAKLGFGSRLEIAREAARRLPADAVGDGASAATPERGGGRRGWG